MRDVPSTLPSRSRTVTSDSTARCRVAVGKLCPAPLFTMRTTISLPSIAVS
jgi:hypothetical protein